MTTHSRGRMSRLATLGIVISLAMLIASCGLLGKKKDEADAAAEAAVAEVAEAGPPPAATAAATNENDISRFPDEKKLENVAATIQRQTTVRENPANGSKVVATLAKGGTVTEIAQRSSFFLVVFDNPKDQKRLMGWIGQESFTAQDTTVKALNCTLPETALLSDQPFCGKICTNDVDCPTGQACKGAANKFTSSVKGDAVLVCITFNRPAASVTPVTPPAATPTVPIVPVTPKCAAGQVFVTQDKTCHVGPCRVGACPANVPLCIACNGTTVCVAAGQRGLCK